MFIYLFIGNVYGLQFLFETNFSTHKAEKSYSQTTG